MGRASKDSVGHQIELFTGPETFSKLKPSTMPLDTPALKIAMSAGAPYQTHSKSRLIAEYIAGFQYVTRGGLYIDGFAAPQSRAYETAWTARRVLEIKPAWLRGFWLCDLDQKAIPQLRALKAKHDRNPRWRRVNVIHGDFNKVIDTILQSGRIHAQTPVFVLLDQRNTECEWATVQKIAGFRTKSNLNLRGRAGRSSSSTFSAWAGFTDPCRPPSWMAAWVNWTGGGGRVSGGS